MLGEVPSVKARTVKATPQPKFYSFKNNICIYWKPSFFPRHSLSVWQCSRRNVHVPLTSACCVYSNIYGLSDIHCIRYLTVVNSIHSTSPPVQKYHHMISGSVHVPVSSTTTNSSSIGEVPVPSDTPHGTRLATNRLFSSAEQGSIITYTNVLKGHITVVLVYCTIEWEPDITDTWKGRDPTVIELEV